MRYETVVASPKGAFYKELGLKLRDARKTAGVSQEQLAKGVGLSRPSIVNIEKGRQPVYIHSLLEIANALGTTLDALLPTSAERPSPQPVADPKARQWFASLNAKQGGAE